MVMKMDKKQIDSVNEKLNELHIPGKVVEMTLAEAKVAGAFVENALSQGDALQSAQYWHEVQARREIVEQVEAIHSLEGMSAKDAPQWFNDLTEEYIQGNVTAEAATQQALVRIRAGDF